MVQVRVRVRVDLQKTRVGSQVMVQPVFASSQKIPARVKYISGRSI